MSCTHLYIETGESIKIELSGIIAGVDLHNRLKEEMWLSDGERVKCLRVTGG
jgi:hypothetical protein